jgi:hypothetical protein
MITADRRIFFSLKKEKKQENVDEELKRMKKSQ